jgi:hypothetical protein
VIVVPAEASAPTTPAATVLPVAVPETGYASEVPPPLPAASLPAAPPPLPPPKRIDGDNPPRRSRYDDTDDEDDLDGLSIRRRPSRRSRSIGMSVTSMILGIAGVALIIAAVLLSVFATAAVGPAGCCVGFLGGYAALGISTILGIMATIFGFIGVRQGGPGYAWTGIITGIIGVLIAVVLFVLTMLGAMMAMGVGAAAAAAQQQQLQQQQRQMQQQRFPNQPIPPPPVRRR